MRTILFALGDNPGMKALSNNWPIPMLPLMDRPFIQHVVEFIAQQGRQKLDIILSHMPQKIEHFLGDGSRWGCEISYHLVNDMPQACRVVRALSKKKDKNCLLVNAACIPQVDVSPQNIEKLAPAGPLLYCLESQGRECRTDAAWSGWAWFPAHILREFPLLNNWAELYTWALNTHPENCTLIKAPHIVCTESYSGLLNSHCAMLEKKIDDLMMTGREVEDGVWLSRNVVIHPGAHITPPVFIDQNTRIHTGVRLGPYAVVGKNCVLDNGTTISHSVILPNTYVGESLELKDVIVDQNRIINERFGSEVTITDDFILSSVRQGPTKWLSGYFSRICAALILAVSIPFLPVIFRKLTQRYNGLNIEFRNTVRIPAPHDPVQWKTYKLLRLSTKTEDNAPDQNSTPMNIKDHFFFHVWPGLVNVMHGDLQLIGVDPRTPEETLALEQEWRDVYLNSKTGLISESFLNFGTDACQEEIYTAEMFYSTTFRRKTDLKLLIRYFKSLFKEITA